MEAGDNKPKNFMEVLAQKVFDEKFNPISFNEKDGKLMAIELIIEHGNKKYLLPVESYPIYIDRLEQPHNDETAPLSNVTDLPFGSGLFENVDEGAEIPDDQDSQSLVVPAEEILPSDLVDLKHRPFEELEPFLIEQTED